MKTRTNPLAAVSDPYYTFSFTGQLLQRLSERTNAGKKSGDSKPARAYRMAARLFELFCMGIVFVFTQCQSVPEVAPTTDKRTSAASARVATTVQTITTLDGTVTQVECKVETLPSGEIIQICVPAFWNGELILYAHGYVTEFEPLRLPLEVATYVPLYSSLGFAFATTSFRQNGLAIQSGIEDMVNLRSLFIKRYGQPKEIYLTGGSQGGIITTLALERYPDLFSGGLSLCGPCGYFQGQINYYGNFRVLFDYFFPGVLPGNAINFPDELILNWQQVYIPKVIAAISQNPAATLKLLSTAKAPYDPANPETIAQTVIGVLSYDVLNFRNAVRVLGGQPFDNRIQIYFGTGSWLEDVQLNRRVQRFSADRAALVAIKNNYETSGNLSRPMVMGHTTQDPIQLFWHLPLYQAKTLLTGRSSFLTPIKVQRYGHCTFTEAEIAAGFSQLVQQVKGQPPLVARQSDAAGKIVRSVSIERR
jgi:pimeloyl-ACP methyl ester carboxylesterase